ncbi:hypothetical protein RJ640_007687 [Escallonia rubra]|uniref:Cytochrome P450 n=1 Tax=Escallonia rubra TaxID=112253 RepID=A0AA88UKC5_9ASTE|nr:hypothetical protein RJ640_007687 [Escallonia rubra]
MDATVLVPIAISVNVLVGFVKWGFKLLEWVWLRPKRLEKCLRELGLAGNRYRLLLGDMGEYASFANQTKSRSISLSDDIAPHVIPYVHHIIHKYGKNSFMWYGPNPRLNIVDPDVIKEMLSKPNIFQKPADPLGEIVTGGLFTSEGQKWSKHRRLINPAFHLEKLKVLFHFLR